MEAIHSSRKVDLKVTIVESLLESPIKLIDLSLSVGISEIVSDDMLDRGFGNNFAARSHKPVAHVAITPC